MFPDLCSALYHFFLVLWQQCVALILKEINILLPGMLSFKQYALFTFSNSSQYYAALCLFFVKKIHIYNTSINHENIAAKIAASDFLPSLNLFHHFQTIPYWMTSFKNVMMYPRFITTWKWSSECISLSSLRIQKPLSPYWYLHSKFNQFNCHTVIFCTLLYINFFTNCYFSLILNTFINVSTYWGILLILMHQSHFKLHH